MAKKRSGAKRESVKLRKALKDSLKEKHALGKGVSRRDIKDIHNWTPLIHSDATYHSYVKQIEYFCNWCYEQGYKTLTPDIDVMVVEYIEHIKARELAPPTQHIALNAIAKALGKRSTDFDVELDKRNRDDYTRSRGIKERDKHFSEENHKELVAFCKSYGLRNEKELQQVRATDFYEKDGALMCHVKGKGGKLREVKGMFESKEEEQLVREYLIEHPKGRLFPPSKVSTAADIHDYRAHFAARVYDANARDINTLPRSERYHKRTGEVYDKKALAKASKALGHGNGRYTDMVNSYARHITSCTQLG